MIKRMLSEADFYSRLPDGMRGRIALHAYGIVDSTNTLAKTYAEERGVTGAHLFIAEGQTAGRGRLGRRFDSAEGGGLYMSLLVDPMLPAAESVRITAAAAVAVCRAIERLTDLTPGIKWVNDVYLGGKKAAGILTEGRIGEGGRMDYAVVGIGLNLYTRPFGELKDIATDIESEWGHAPDKSEMAAAIAEELLGLLAQLDSAALTEEYRRRSCIIGRSVTVASASGSYPATVEGITDECHLRVIREDGTRSTLLAGEVSLRQPKL